MDTAYCLYTASRLQNLIDIVTELKGNSKGEQKIRKCLI